MKRNESSRAVVPDHRMGHRLFWAAAVLCSFAGGPSPMAAEKKAPRDPAAWRITIGAAGDALLHIGVKNSANAMAADAIQTDDRRYGGWWSVFKRIQPSAARADIAVVNLESPIATERHAPSLRGAILNGPVDALRALEAAGIDLVNLANNHLYDQLRPGVEETLDAIDTTGLVRVGAGVDKPMAARPTIVERRGVKVAFFGWSINSNRYSSNKKVHEPWVMRWEPDEARAAIAQARSTSDLIVANVHFDADFIRSPAQHQKKVARFLCRQGVDLVLGTGPHVLHPVRMLSGDGIDGTCLVAYSLGNLVSNQGLMYRPSRREKKIPKTADPRARDGLFLRVTFAKRGDQIEIERIEGVPLWTENNWLERYNNDPIAPHRIWIHPFLSALKAENDPPSRAYLHKRLQSIQRAVGDLVDIVPE